jgi:clan AA aspartic protease
MGLTNITATIMNPKNTAKKETVELLVDSGAAYSVVSAQILKDLGIKPFSEETFYLANNTSVKRKIGGAAFQYGDKTGYANVIFGKSGDSNLLGVTTLESLGYVLDPLQRRLLKLPMILGKVSLERSLTQPDGLTNRRSQPSFPRDGMK